jgi:hypothetical protein
MELEGGTVERAVPHATIFRGAAWAGLARRFTLEFLALRAGHATHITAAMLVSIAVSVVSLFFNWLLMRNGLLVTGAGSARLLDDMRRLPAVLRGFRGRRA